MVTRFPGLQSKPAECLFQNMAFWDGGVTSSSSCCYPQTRLCRVKSQVGVSQDVLLPWDALDTSPHEISHLSTGKSSL